MTDIEMTVEALKRCVDPDAFSKAMEDLQGGQTKQVGIAVPKKASVELVTKSLLREVGIPAHIKGYRYAVAAIVILVGNPDAGDAITKELYPGVAEMCGTTASRVERAIRHGVEVAWSRGDLDVLKEYFGNTVSGLRGKPTNSEFLTRMAEAVLEEMAE